MANDKPMPVKSNFTKALVNAPYVWSQYQLSLHLDHTLKENT